MCGPDWEFGDARGGGEELRDADGAKVVYFIFRGADLLFFAYKRPRAPASPRTVGTQDGGDAVAPYHSTSPVARTHPVPCGPLCQLE